MFYGPVGSGKTLAIRALATECNAILIDISPSTIGQIFSDKKQIDRLINFAFKVAKEYQPAIIYCDDLELVFLGKKKKGVLVSNFYAKMKKPI